MSNSPADEARKRQKIEKQLDDALAASFPAVVAEAPAGSLVIGALE